MTDGFGIMQGLSVVRDKHTFRLNRQATKIAKVDHLLSTIRMYAQRNGLHIRVEKLFGNDCFDIETEIWTRLHRGWNVLAFGAEAKFHKRDFL